MEVMQMLGSVKILPLIILILHLAFPPNYCLASFFSETLQNQSLYESAETRELDNANDYELMNVTHIPEYPQPNQKVTIRVRIRGSPINVSKVILSYCERLNYNWYGIHQYWGIYEWSWEPLTWNIYTDWINVTMANVGDDIYEAVIPELPYYTIVWYEIYVLYDLNRIAKSDIQTYYVVRGTEYIIYFQASNIANRILYVGVALALIYGLKRRSSLKK